MQDTIPSEIPVTIGEGDSAEVFNFRIPSPRDYARLGTRALAMRRADDPGAMGMEFGLDFGTIDLYRGMALLETLLTSATVTWPYTKDQKGDPVVDSNKFPPEATSKVARIYQGFLKALEDFRIFGD
jgi:hypothetical protein